MTGQVIRKGEVIYDETYISGGGEPGYHPEVSHTEQKFLGDVRPIVQEGDILRMSGELNPCSRGRSCQAAIRDNVARVGVSAEYYASTTGMTYKWEKIGNNLVRQTEIDSSGKIVQYEYNTETKRRKQVSTLCGGG
jgi:hypothetical protein